VSDPDVIGPDVSPDVAPDMTALRMTGIGKRFGGVAALDGVDLTLFRGQIHALLGENGAGKSTLIKILTGVQPADSGTIRLGDRVTRLATPKDARAAGITLVPQDILMVPRLSLGRNILLGLEGPRARAQALSGAERERVDAALARVGVRLDPTAPAGSFSVPHLRLAQIARALLHPGDVLVLDEPTAVLSESDSERLLERLESLRADGKAILYVTHRLSEVMRLADRITILRDGKRVGHFGRGEIGRDQIVRLMAKPERRAAAGDPLAAAAPLGPPVLEVRGLSASGALRGVSLTARQHEIVGVAGVQGSGHGKLLRAIAGVDAADDGRVTLDGESIRLGSVRQAYRRGMLLVPADRRGAAVVPRQSIRANLVLSHRIRAAARRLGLRMPGRERRLAREHIDSLDVRPADPEARMGLLSGGNQQKVALARALESNARVLLIEEPTQGIDVRTKADIHALLRRVARERDCAVIVASSEFEELIGLADVIHVMSLGRLVHSLPGATATYRDILGHALP
jgi:ABC-type sugar transport system ATPase subunit